MQDYEQLGSFYLGRETGPDGGLLLYNSKHLTTHAMIVGMTGSGKTGLALTMMEEAAIDGIPAILIDPKGDLADLLLQFPNLAPEDFRPWVDPGQAQREGVSLDELAAKTAEQWGKGLSKWGQDGSRIRRLAGSADFAIYTPGDPTGRPLQILRSFDAPKGLDETALRDTILNNVSNLLGLVGVQADPFQSREHILLSAIFNHAWRKGQDLDLPQIIQSVGEPPFAKIGVFDVDSFFPKKERSKLAMSLNALVASPSFAAWREGEPLDVEALLHAGDGRPRISILSIAHLSDAERMFFVTALLNAVLAWMRRQTGTGSLRALLYMDEIFGYFPPTANPPSKAPMLTLLKQARAFGLGIVLSTQNPVDLDYKGLSNCGTWFIGRLQTDRDKQRVLDGLEGAAADSGKGFDRSAMDKLLSGLGKRVFLMRDAADDQPVLFETRWCMSYLSGPLSLPQIKGLIREKCPPPASAAAFGMPDPFAPTDDALASALPDPFAPTSDAASATGPKPEAVAATVRMHFVSATSKLDEWTTLYLLAPMSADESPDWASAARLQSAAPRATSGAMVSDKRLAIWQKMLSSHLYQNETLTLWRDHESKLISKPGEEEGEFRVRAAQNHREKRDLAIEKVKETYSTKLLRLQDQVRKAEDRVTKEKAQMKQKRFSTLVYGGATLLGALLGRNRSVAGSIGRASSTARSASGIGKEKQDVEIAEQNVEVLRERLESLDAEFKEALAQAQSEVNPQSIELEEIMVRPRKSDTLVETVYLA